MKKYRVLFFVVVGGLIFVGALAGLSALYPAYGEICEYPQNSQQKECAAYSLPLYLAIKIGKYLDAISAALTAIATAVICWFTYTLWQSSEKMWLASNTALRHSEQTAEHQLRAYLTVIIGSAVYQERDKQLRFQASPLLLNTGQTPAHRVRYRINADLLPIPLPANFNFPLPALPVVGGVVGPQQNAIMVAVVPGYCDDALVNEIRAGIGQALYVWGTVFYDDAFGNERTTDFAQMLTWRSDGHIWGQFIPEHSRTT